MENANTNPTAVPAAEGATAQSAVGTTTTPASPPAGGEQASQLNQMIDKMLAGLDGKETAAGKEAASAAYTPAQLDALVAEKLEAAKAEWTASNQPEDKNAPKPSVEDEVAALKAQLLEKDLRATAVAELGKEGYPTGLAELLRYGSEAEMKKNLAATKTSLTQWMSDILQEKLKGKTPPGLGGAQNPVSPNLSPAAKMDALNAHRIVK